VRERFSILFRELDSRTWFMARYGHAQIKENLGFIPHTDASGIAQDRLCASTSMTCTFPAATMLTGSGTIDLPRLSLTCSSRTTIRVFESLGHCRFRRSM